MSVHYTCTENGLNPLDTSMRNMRQMVWLCLLKEILHSMVLEYI